MHISKLILAAFAVIFSSLSFAQSNQASRSLVESFASNLTKELRANGFCKDPCLHMKVAYWPQISQKFFIDRGVNPQEKGIGFTEGMHRWAIISTSQDRIAVLFASAEDFIQRASEDQVVANVYSFKTAVVPKEGLRIIPDRADAWLFGNPQNGLFVTKREFFEKGFADKLEKIYSSGSNPTNKKLTEICEAQKATCLASCPRDRVFTTQLDNECSVRCRRLECSN